MQRFDIITNQNKGIQIIKNHDYLFHQNEKKYNLSVCNVFKKLKTNPKTDPPLPQSFYHFLQLETTDSVIRGTLEQFCRNLTEYRRVFRGNCSTDFFGAFKGTQGVVWWSFWTVLREILGPGQLWCAL